MFYASQIGAKLDSDVISGGGTDDTAILQAVLDKALEIGSVHLIMDGAALVTGLNVSSNTTIECLNQSCGFYMADNSNRSIIINAHWDFEKIQDKNITLIGGIYNHNCMHQEHHIIENAPFLFSGQGIVEDSFPVIAIQFYGVENLTIKGLTIQDQRTYAVNIANWYHVNIQDVRIDLPNCMHGQNQDGIHVFGPGQFLNIHNVSGRTSDDFIALGPDEFDGISSISDVLIDGVFLDDADQAIRMLCCGKGKLDRVVVKNVIGRYRSYGCFLNPFFPTTEGNYGNIIFDTIDLRQTQADYTYTPSFLFRVGGRFESITFRNIYHHNPNDNRGILDIGWQFYADDVEITPEMESRIGSILIDGLHIVENNPKSEDAEYIKIKKSHINNITIRNVEIIRDKNMPTGGCLVKTMDGADIDTMFMNSICVNKMDNLVKCEKGKINTLMLTNILAQDMKNTLVSINEGTIKKLFSDVIYGTDAM